MRLLRVHGPCLVHGRLFGQQLAPELFPDIVACLSYRLRRDVGRIRTHVGDQAHALTLTQVHTSYSCWAMAMVRFASFPGGEKRPAAACW